MTVNVMYSVGIELSRGAMVNESTLLTLLHKMSHHIIEKNKNKKQNKT